MYRFIVSPNAAELVPLPSSLAIELLRVDQRVGDRRPVAIARGAEEAGAASGVAGDALLVDAEQQRIAVAIEAQLDQALDLPRGLALAPQPAARARPVAGLAAGDGLGHRRAVHP